MLTSVFSNFYANRGSGAAFGFIADECNFKTVERKRCYARVRERVLAKIGLRSYQAINVGRDFR